MAELRVTNVVKAFGGHPVLRGVSLVARDGEFVVLLGPSGCGKTTLLRLIAGLEWPDDGTVEVDGEVIASPKFSLPPEKRGMAMVFQNYALWPHRTVFDNVAYGLRMRGEPSARVQERVKEMLRRVGLDGVGRRFPSQLSGGQQQRIALARALIVQPRILLMDEPLSNLDALLRTQVRHEIRQLQRELGLTVVYVTHDQTEALALADHLVVMWEGRIEQEGNPEEIYRWPTTARVASFLGATNFFSGTVQQVDPHGRVCVETRAGPIWGRISEKSSTRPQTGQPAAVAVRPVELVLSADEPATTGCNVFHGVVRQATFLGDLVEYVVDLKGLTVLARSLPGVRFEPGSTVRVSFSHDAGAVVALEPDVSASVAVDPVTSLGRQGG